MEVKAEFCASLKPRFFLLDSVDSTDSLNQDSLFDIEDVGRVLSCPQAEKVILSVSGRRPADFSKLMLCMQRLTHWQSLFPMNVSSVLRHLQDVENLCELGHHLGVPNRTVADILSDPLLGMCSRKNKLVQVWLSSSLTPRWWHLVQAFKGAGMAERAEEIQSEYCKL
jgi:hypothetical protein